MKGKLLFLFFFFSPFSLFAQIIHSESFHLSIEPTFSYSSGVLNESLYHSQETSKKISLLEWERKVWMYGFRLDASFRKFHLKGGFESAIPSSSGEMRDSDWLNYSDYSMKTTYSVGTNYSDRNFDSFLSLSYDFEPAAGLSLSPEAQIQYSFDSFHREKGAEGWYGHSDYSSDGKNHWWYEDEASHFPSTYWSDEKGRYVTRKLAGIDYYRHSLYFWTGLSLAFRFHRFYAEFSFLLSPFTYLSAEDRHHTAGDDKVFHEIQEDYFTSYKLDLNLSYTLSEYFDLTLSGSLLIVSDIRGELYEGWTENKYQAAGGGSQAGTIRLGCRIKVL